MNTQTRRENRIAFRKLVLKAFGLLTGNFDFQKSRIQINGTLVPVWNARTQDLVAYMVSKGGDFRNVRSLEDLRQVVRASQIERVPQPQLRKALAAR
jgi:hypothetical protein